MSKLKSRRSQKRNKNSATPNSRTPASSSVAETALTGTETPAPPPSIEVNPAAIDAYLEKQALQWLTQPTDLAAKLSSAGLSVQDWNGTLFATTGTGSAGLLFYTPETTTSQPDLMAMLAALKAYSPAESLPVPVKILIGPVSETLLEAHKAELAASAIVYGLGEYSDGRPLVSLGLKGLLEAELRVRTMSQDAPSAYSEIMPAASWVIVRALDALKSDSQEIKIDQFEDDLSTLPAEESRRLLKSVPEHSARLVRRLEQYGLKSYIFELGDALVLQTEYRVPAVNISSIECGQFETGGLKLPASARARLDFHLLPDQHPDRIFQFLKEYLVEKNFDGLEVLQLPGSVRPSRTPLDHPFVQKALEVIESASGQVPLVAPISPFSGGLFWLKQAAGSQDIPAICIGLGSGRPAEADFITQAKILAHLLPAVAAFQIPVGPHEELTFEMPPELELEAPAPSALSLSDIEVSLPSAPVATEDELLEPFNPSN